ncbi:hypothetical protein DFH08DRAFT_941426 [Mycena albidolilacea]|uniref:Uncharacterized protein n=1 Tax=Mycena albidolilacea TaxID=1033008 RepID=A0AAD6ZIK8_9AGAR|nr:hypothetical protein DFH08DRAFT_941426 [Mycena albidolilacea]
MRENYPRNNQGSRITVDWYELRPTLPTAVEIWFDHAHSHIEARALPDGGKPVPGIRQVEWFQEEHRNGLGHIGCGGGDEGRRGGRASGQDTLDRHWKIISAPLKQFRQTPKIFINSVRVRSDNPDSQDQDQDPGSATRSGLELVLVQPETLSWKWGRRVDVQEKKKRKCTWSQKSATSSSGSDGKGDVVPLARKLAGTLEPWLFLTVAQVQGIVDRVFGPGRYMVEKNGPWFELVTYHLTDWRAGFVLKAPKALEYLVKGTKERLKVQNTSDAADIEDEDPDGKLFDFTNAEGIAEFCRFTLTQHKPSQEETDNGISLEVLTSARQHNPLAHCCLLYEQSSATWVSGEVIEIIDDDEDDVVVCD